MIPNDGPAAPRVARSWLRRRRNSEDATCEIQKSATIWHSFEFPWAPDWQPNMSVVKVAQNFDFQEPTPPRQKASLEHASPYGGSTTCPHDGTHTTHKALGLSQAHRSIWRLRGSLASLAAALLTQCPRHFVDALLRHPRAAP